MAANETYMLACFSKDEDSWFENQYRSIEELEAAVLDYKHYNNIYASLSTIEEEKSRSRENIMTRCVLAWDFDKKDFEEGFNHRDVMRRFQKAGVYYHMMVDSGRGYHVYIAIDPTNDIDKVIEVTAAIGNKVGADPHAMLPTQLLRVPESYNYKEGEKKKCNLMWLHETQPKAIEYNLDKLHKKHCSQTKKTSSKLVSNKNMMPCIANLMNGVESGHRNFALGRITKWMQKVNHSKARAWNEIKDWNSLCAPPEDEAKLERDFNKYWDSNYKLLGCVADNEKLQSMLSEYCNRNECEKLDKYEIIHTEKAVTIEHKIAEKMRATRRGKGMTGNHIAVVSILKLFPYGLTRKQIEEELTTKKTDKPAISKNTLTKVLKELVEEYELLDLQVRGRSNFYKIKSFKALESQKFVFGYGTIRGFLHGDISSSELKLYCYMRYRLSRGDNVVQEEIAEDLNLDQKTISNHVKSLEEARYLVINTDYSINPLGANVYEWIVQ